MKDAPEFKSEKEKLKYFEPAAMYCETYAKLFEKESCNAVKEMPKYSRDTSCTKIDQLVVFFQYLKKQDNVKNEQYISFTSI